MELCALTTISSDSSPASDSSHVAYWQFTRKTTSFSMFFIQLFFVAMLIFPTALQLQRGVFLGILLVLSSFISIRCWTVHRDIFLFWLATLLVGIFGITLGLTNNAPGALRVSTVYIVWPIIYFVFIGLAHKLSVIRQLETALLVGISAATIASLTVLVAGV